MRRRIFFQSAMTVMLATTALLATGCGKADYTSEGNMDVNDTASKTTGESTVISETTDVLNEATDDETTDVINESTDDETMDVMEETSDSTEINSDVSFMTTKGFDMLSYAADEEYIFDREYSDDEDIAPYYRQVTFTKQCPLAGEEVDSIKVFCDAENCVAYIEINGERVELPNRDIVDVWTVDVDCSDTYKEVVLVDAGASDDWAAILVRYVDGKVCVYDAIPGGSDQVLINAKGQIISSLGYVDFLDTQIVTEYLEIEKDKLVSVPVDKSSALNQKYEVSKDIFVAFKEAEEDEFDFENLVELRVDDEILLIDANTSEGVYYVELPDGRRGYIITQVAG